MKNDLLRAFLLSLLLAGLVACGKEDTSAQEPVAEQQSAQPAPEQPAGETETQPEAAAEQAPAEETTPETAGETAQDRRQRERDPEVEMAQMLHDIWWNSPEIYSALNLTEEQRSEMDAHLAEFSERQFARTESTPQLMEQYREAIQAADFDEAKRLSDEMAAIAGEGMSANFVLQMAVLQTMDAEQMAKAIADYPGVMARQWVRGRRVMGAQQLGRNASAERGVPGMGQGQGQRRGAQGERRKGDAGQRWRGRQGQGQGQGQGEGDAEGDATEGGDGDGDADG